MNTTCPFLKIAVPVAVTPDGGAEKTTFGAIVVNPLPPAPEQKVVTDSLSK
jgi:hypothetical protein